MSIIYRVIEFEEPRPLGVKNQFVVVPDSWVATFDSYGEQSRALVKFPVNKSSRVTNDQVRTYKPYLKQWESYTGRVIFTIDNLEDANKMVALKRKEKKFLLSLHTARNKGKDAPSDTPTEERNDKDKLYASPIKKTSIEKAKRKTEDDSSGIPAKKPATETAKRKREDDSSGIPAKKPATETVVKEKIKGNISTSRTRATMAGKDNNSSVTAQKKQGIETAEKSKHDTSTTLAKSVATDRKNVEKKVSESNKENTPHSREITTTENTTKVVQLKTHDPNIKNNRKDKHLSIKKPKNHHETQDKVQNKEISSCQIVIRESGNIQYHFMKKIHVSKERHEKNHNIARQTIAKYFT